MSRLGVLGLGVMGVGAVFGSRHNNGPGVAFASMCLIVGLVLIVAAEARGLILKPVGAKANSTDGMQARVIVLVKGGFKSIPSVTGSSTSSRIRTSPMWSLNYSSTVGWCSVLSSH